MRREFSVFISSTSENLKDLYRVAARDVVLGMKLRPERQEYFVASGSRPFDECMALTAPLVETTSDFVMEITLRFDMMPDPSRNVESVAQRPPPIILLLGYPRFLERGAHRREVRDVSLHAISQSFEIERVVGVEIGRAVIPERLLDIGKLLLQLRRIGCLPGCIEFGVKIGTFQGLQHRAAHLFCEIELVKSTVLRALQALDAQEPAATSLVCLAKAKASDVARLATNEAVQMHGGIGMTDEFDIGFFMKRARAAGDTFGDAYYHTDRYAQLAGY